MVNVNGTAFTLGVDPECFLWDKRRKRYVSAHGKFDGTKERPLALGYRLPRCYVQVDGVALEFNTRPYAYVDFFHGICDRVIRELKRIVGMRLGPNFTLKFTPTAEFDDEEWENTPPEAKVLGCDPDYNGWTLDLNDPPDGDAVQFRTGAGHVHIGWSQHMEIDDDLLFVGGQLAKELDARVGVASLLFDNDTRRRILYGKAGAFRPKHYGMEYRTLSNKWLSTKALRLYTIARVNETIKKMAAKETIATPEVQDIINNNRLDDAKHWLSEHRITLPPAQHRVD